MRIYKIYTEYKETRNFDNYCVHADSYEEAVEKAQKEFRKGEKIEWVELLAESDF